MKIINDKECGILVADSISKYPNAVRITALYDTIKKLTPYLIITAFISANVLLRYTDIKNLILSYFGLQGLSTLLGSLFMVIITLLIFFVMTVVHEFVHLLGYIKDFKNSYLIISKKTVSAYNSKWVTKTNQLVTLLLPFLFFLLAAVIILIITKNIDLFYLITLLNLGGSCSDIIAFFILLNKAPKNSLILGHYYRIP